MDAVSPSELLRAFPSGKRLASSDLRELIEAGTTLRLLEGSVLFDAGDRSDAAFLVVAGRVRIERLLESGQRVALGRLGRGHVVGDMGLISGEVRSASAVVEEEALALRLDAAAYTRLRDDAHPAALWLLGEIQRRMSERIGGMYDRLARVAEEPGLIEDLPTETAVPLRWWERWIRRVRL
jgi:CRP-like cAMP-binding protein